MATKLTKKKLTEKKKQLEFTKSVYSGLVSCDHDMQNHSTRYSAITCCSKCKSTISEVEQTMNKFKVCENDKELKEQFEHFE